MDKPQYRSKGWIVWHFHLLRSNEVFKFGLRNNCGCNGMPNEYGKAMATVGKVIKLSSFSFFLSGFLSHY